MNCLTLETLNSLKKPMSYIGISGRIKTEFPYFEKGYWWVNDCGGTKATTVPIVNENTESHESEGPVKN